MPNANFDIPVPIRHRTADDLRSRFEKNFPMQSSTKFADEQEGLHRSVYDDGAMTGPTREELDAKLETIEHKMDARISKIQGQIDLFLARAEERDIRFAVTLDERDKRQALAMQEQDKRLEERDKRLEERDKRLDVLAEQANESAKSASSLKMNMWAAALTVIVTVVAAYFATQSSNIMIGQTTLAAVQYGQQNPAKEAQATPPPSAPAPTAAPAHKKE